MHFYLYFLPQKTMENTKITDEKLSAYNEITDERLYELCKRYGSSALLWRRKFTGLLPEVDRRRLYERKGFSTVFEFAFKLCGLSIDQVRLALNLEKRFDDMPVLKKMLEGGEVSINKLARVVSIATTENEAELAEKIRVLPKSALETLVRDEKRAINENGLHKPQRPLFGSLPEQTSANDIVPEHLPGQTFELAPDVTEQLNELHSKEINVNELLRKFLKQRKEEIEKKKEEIAEKTQPTSSRYVPAKVKEVLHQEHGTKCSIPTCQKPAEVIHHTQTFGLSHTHDPRFMAPLCHEHHMIAHSMDVKYHEMRRMHSTT